MDEKQWLKKAIQAILSQNKSDVEKAEEIVEMMETLETEEKNSQQHDKGKVRICNFTFNVKTVWKI